MDASRVTFAQRLFRALMAVVLCQVLGIPDAAGQATQQRQQSSRFTEWDKNNDGFLSKDEFPSRFPQGTFQRIDANHDGRLSRQEDDAFRTRNRRGRDQSRGRDQGPRLPEGTQVDRNIVYETVGERQLPLDLYRPGAVQKPTPLVVWIHGGGWRGGSKNGAGPALGLLKRGYAVASVEYRLSGEAIFPAAIEDCKAAVSFLRLHAGEYNLDPDKFGVWGSSAGGHLAALLGTTNDVSDFDTHPVTKKAPATVQAVCDWYGPTDFLRMNDFPGRIDHDAPGSPESLFIGGPIQENKEKSALANPINYVSETDPPFFIMHGEIDQAVPYNQSELLHAALTTSGVRSTLQKVVKGDHGFRGADEDRTELAERAMDFFDSIFKPGR